MTHTVLGLDAGGSSTKWVLQRGPATLGSGRAAPLTSALLGLPEGQETLQQLRASLPQPPEAIFAGVPGLSSGSPRAQEAAQTLATAFGLTAEQVTVRSDLDLAYSAHLQPGEGILLYAGTGSIAYHVSLHGQTVRAGGRGYRIGDDGAAASLGREAMRWVTDALDRGQVPAGPLAEELAAITGSLDWETLRAFVYGTPGAASLARLAPAVSRAAQRGDGTSLVLLRQAALSLAELASKVRQQVGPLPVVATGGTLQSPVLQESLKAALPGVTIQFRDHALAAALSALGAASQSDER